MIRYSFNSSQGSFYGNGSTPKQVDCMSALSDIAHEFATVGASFIRPLRRQNYTVK